MWANPLGKPKLLLGDRVVVVRDARVAETTSHAAPGTAMPSLDGTVTVSTASGDVVLTLAEPVRDIPNQLPLVDGELRDRLAAAAPSIARGERYWTAALTHLAPVELPYPRELAYRD